MSAEPQIVIAKPEDIVPPAVAQKANEVLSVGRLLCSSHAPYFRSMLMSFVHRMAPGLGTVAVSHNAIFQYDPFVISRWTPKVMAGALAHECCHLWQKHIKRRGTRDPFGWNVAADMSINPNIFEIGLELPPGVAMPADLNMANGLTADEYYRELEKQGKCGGEGDEGEGDDAGEGDGDAQGKEGQGKGKGGGKDADHSPGGKGKKKQKGAFGAGRCGSCAGHGDPENDPAEGDPEGRSQQQMERVARQTSEAIKDAQQSRTQGRLPAGWLKEAEASLEPPVVPWQQKLAAVTRAIVTYRPGGVVHRFDGPSKKQGGIGFGVGRPILPRMRTPVPNVAVLIDTSGSMGSKETTEVLREVRGVLKACDATVQVCVCDAAVHGMKRVADINSVVRMLKGGGGSDFTPAFEELGRTLPRPDVVVALTDGYISVPEKCPLGMRVIWVLVGGNERPPAQWGEPIVINDRPKKGA